jgi:hypothetical protein
MKSMSWFGVAWAVMAVAFWVCGCGGNCRADSERAGPKGSGAPRPTIRSTAYLRRLLRLGMATNDIVTVLGRPDWTEQIAPGKERWDYLLPPFQADDEMRGTWVFGVGLLLTNGCLVDWGYSYVTSLGGAQGTELTKTNKGSSALQLFVVEDGPSPGARLIDTARFPKLGYVAAKPAMVISTVKSVTAEEPSHTALPGAQGRVWTFSIYLTEADGARLKALTEENLGKKVAMVLDEEVVCAPKVLAPITTGSFLIRTDDPALAQRLKSGLAGIQREAQ